MLGRLSMIRTAVIGLGPIGLATAAAIAQSPGLALTGLIDINPELLGLRLADLFPQAQVPPRSGPPLPAVVGLVEEVHADVLLLCTSSRLDAVAPTLRQAIGRRCHVVSSCEEMSYPRYGNAALADELDAAAKDAGVALLGTGVNPGFVMDLLPVVLASMALGIQSVRVVRRVDAATRRQPLQAKVGARMTPAQFAGLAAKNSIGHAGIGQSVALLAAGLGRTVEPDSVRITLEPVIAQRATPSLLGEIRPGQVCGMRNTAKWSGDGLSIDLDLTMAVGLPDPQDRVELSAAGSKPLVLTIAGSTPGDSATVAALVNGARAIGRQRPGLLTMLDVTPLGSGRLN
jgi:4-hydroxy-tetrahydrodipicolinate reductase